MLNSLRIFPVFIFLLSLGGQAVAFNTGTWNVVGLKYNVSPKWILFSEAQIRSLRFYHFYHYYEYKGGFTFKPVKNLSLSLGAGSYQTYLEGGNFVLPKNNDEFRIWPQLILNQQYGVFKIEQRYRSEFRFTSNGFRNRYRYRSGISFEFGKGIKSYNQFMISASNELFFTDLQPYFERNRIALALSYFLSPGLSVQLGYIHQFDYKINDETGRDFMQIGVYFELFRGTMQGSNSVPDLKDN